MFHHNVIIFNVYNFLLRIAILITIRTTTHTNMIHTQWFINILHESLNYVPELARYFMHIQGNKCVCTQSTTLLLCSLSLSHTHCTHIHTHTQMAASDLGNSRWSIWKSGKVLYYLLSPGRDKLAVCQRMEEGNWFFKRVNKIWQLNFLCTNATLTLTPTLIHQYMEPCQTCWIIQKTKPEINTRTVTSYFFLWPSFSDVYTKKYLPECQLRKKLVLWFVTMPGSSPTAQQFALESHAICITFGSGVKALS